jgi:hypothetical protein
VKRLAQNRRLPSSFLLRLVLSAVVTACASALLLGGCSTSSRGTPDLTGLTSDEATKLAGDSGLKLVQSAEVPSFLPPGTVLAQDPLSGIDSADGTVKVTVGREPIEVQITKVKAADPDGDGSENDSALPKLTDGDVSTSWSTEQTYKSPDFQGLGNKKGVGLSFWLAEGATMLKISYTMTGWKGEVEKILSDNTPVAVAPLGEAQQVSWSGPLTSGRIWFYQLAPLPMSADNIQRYGVIINEISFYK